VPFAYGFRPFFLAAIAYGLVAVPAWMILRSQGIMPLSDLPPQLWHGHEMLFGFIAAAIAGFLLTAVPSWTGLRGFAGWPLIVLFILWLAGRLAFACSASLPFPLVAALDLAFLPMLAVLLAVPLVRSRNRNTPLLVVIGGLWTMDVVFMSALARHDVAMAMSALGVALNVILLLVTVIGGRIVPAFTASSLRRRGIAADVRSRRIVDITAIGSMMAIIVVDVIAPGHPIAIAVTWIAVLAHAVRLAGWQGVRTMGEPIVWVLHLAYLWLPVGLALKAIHMATGVGWASQWLHALSVGVAAIMIMAVITRATLGHTGRQLVVSKFVAFAYGVLGASALARVLATTAPQREWALWVAAGLWVMAFLVVLVIYAPMLVRPRVDGKAG
jgi:uncharacterized protein involved in response to NO